MNFTQNSLSTQRRIFEPFRNELIKEYSFWKINILAIVGIFSVFTTIFLGYLFLRYISFNAGGDIQVIYDYPAQDWIRLPKYIMGFYIAIPLLYISILLGYAKSIYEINPKIVVGLLWLGVLLNLFLIIGLYQIISLNI